MQIQGDRAHADGAGLGYRPVRQPSLVLEPLVLASKNGRYVNLLDHVRRLYAGRETGRATDSHCGRCLRPSRRVVRVLRVTAAGSLSLLPAFRPIALHPVRDRLLCLG